MAAEPGIAAVAPLEQPAGPCGCQLDDLPELAAEKLATLLLLLPSLDADEHGRPQATQQQQHPPQQPGAESPDGAPPRPAPGKQCGRSGCRKCSGSGARGPATAPTDGGAVPLRAEWEALLRLTPLGLFSSLPILGDELAYLRLQLGQLEGLLGVAEGEGEEGSGMGLPANEAGRHGV